MKGCVRSRKVGRLELFYESNLDLEKSVPTKKLGPSFEVDFLKVSHESEKSATEIKKVH